MYRDSDVFLLYSSETSQPVVEHENQNNLLKLNKQQMILCSRVGTKYTKILIFR